MQPNQEQMQAQQNQFANPNPPAAAYDPNAANQQFAAQNPQAMPQMAPDQQPMPGQPLAQNQQAQQPQTMGKKEDPKSTQGTLLISELRDSMVIMKDGSFRAVIACKSINFDLMSNNEREGVEYSYQSFLNSLNFPCQILIRSQRVDIGPYLADLAEKRRNEDNMLLGRLMDDYINFIDIISQEANIMDKSFFIVIPYYTSKELQKQAEQTKSLVGVISKNTNTTAARISRDDYDKAVTELNNYCESAVSGLYYMGVHGVRLNTRELSTLFYNFNNPDTAVHEPLGDFNKLAHLYVRKSKLGEEL